jgi:hypothetical protein
MTSENHFDIIKLFCLEIRTIVFLDNFILILLLNLEILFSQVSSMNLKFTII